MRLDARFVNIIYKVAEHDPPTTQKQGDIPEGALWLNELTGKIFIALKHPTKKNTIVWLSLGDQENYLKAILNTTLSKAPCEITHGLSNTFVNMFSTVNVIDVFNDNSIVAFYPFDGHANDLANGYHGTWYPYAYYDRGVFGRAAKFTRNNYIRLPDSLIPNIATVSLWFNIEESGGYPKIFTVDDQPDDAFMLGHRTEYNYILLEINDDGEEGRADYQPLSLYRWYHAVIVIDRSKNTTYLFLDGKLVYKANKVPNIISGVYVGSESRGCCSFKGLVDQLRIFNRPLTPEEVLILYNENYLITKALKLLTNKLGGIKKEFIYIPGGDNITKLRPEQPIDVTGKAKIFKVTNPPPQVKESDYGKELYFPDNTAIAFKGYETLHTPFTISMCFKIDKPLNGFLFGVDYCCNPLTTPANEGLELHYGNDGYGVKLILATRRFNIRESVEQPPVGRYILLTLQIDSTYALLTYHDKNTGEKLYEKKITFPNKVSYLYSDMMGLGANIRTLDSSEYSGGFVKFANAGLHLQSFRIFKGILSEEDKVTLAKEHAQKGVLLTEYLPKVKVYDTLDQNLEVFYNFDKIDTRYRKIIDLSGNNRHGILRLADGENIQDAFVPGVFGKALNCKAVDPRVTITGLPTDVDFLTVCFWMYWTGIYGPVDGDMVFTFPYFHLWLYEDKFGFNTGSGDVYGIDNISLKLRKKWVHVCAVFPKQSTTNLATTGAELWINGEKQSIEYVRGYRSRNVSISSTATISGIRGYWNEGFHGYIDQFRIYSRKLSEKEIKLLAKERCYFIR